MRYLIVFLAGLVMAATASAETADRPRTVTVEGVGRVSAAPDTAVVHFGVQREAREAEAAMQAASNAMAEVLQSVAAIGIPTERVQTTRIGLDPRWRHSDDGSAPRVVGYVATNTVRVEVRDFEDLGPLLDTVVSGGANTMNGLAFEIADSAALEDEARLGAVSDARRKAERIVEAVGASLGPVLSIVEGGQAGRPVPMFEAADAMRSAVPVAAGELDVTVTVRAEFEIVD